MRHAAGQNHSGLHLLLVLIPATGIAAWFFGVHDAGEIHQLVFTAGWMLACLHVVAVLYRQFVRRDGTLLRMWRPAGQAFHDSPH